MELAWAIFQYSNGVRSERFVWKTDNGCTPEWIIENERPRLVGWKPTGQEIDGKPVYIECEVWNENGKMQLRQKDLLCKGYNLGKDNSS